MKKLALLCIILFSLVCRVNSQEDSAVIKLASFVKNIITFNQLYPQEKVYLHFDNSGYYAGENIWFKAYVVVAESHVPTILSRVLYVELLSPEGEVLETKKLLIENGQCNGNFLLKADRYAGFYQVRAYTRFLLNSEESVFSRVFPVFDAPKSGEYLPPKMKERPHSLKVISSRVNGEKLKNVNVMFFPEGGNLIKGLPSRIAFKAMDDKGRGIDVTGTVYNGNKEVVTSFSSIHNGSGRFEFLSENTSGYTVDILHEGKSYSFKLPSVSERGYVMTVDNIRPDTAFVRILKSKDQLPEVLGMTVTCRGQAIVFELVDMTSVHEYVLNIPKEKMQSGVNRITLFNAAGEIFSERSVFVDHGEGINITSFADKAEYKPYDKVNMEFLAKDKEGNPAELSFSLSVKDAGTTLNSFDDNIRTNLLLSSDLKGYIENIGYYFESDDDKHRTALDLLMMTQGWYRYSWKESAGIEPYELKHYIEEGIVIDGQVLSLRKKKEKEGVEVNMWMYSDDGFSRQGTCMTDEDGRFNFLPDDFYGTWNLSLQTKEKDKVTDNRIVLNRLFSPEPKAYSFFDTQLSSIKNNGTGVSFSELVKESKNIEIETDSVHSKALPEVSVSGKQTNEREGAGMRYANIIYDVGAEIDKITDKGDGYNENIAKFLLKTNKYFSYDPPKYDPNGDYMPTECYYKNKPVVFLVNDKVLGEDTGETIDDFSTSEIDKIIIAEKAGAVSSVVSDKYVAIYLYTNKTGRRGNLKGMRLTELRGFSHVQDFYNPDYSNGIIPVEEDYRRTLYWNPTVKTNEEGKASVGFYNNETCRKMIIDAETLTSDGIPGMYKNNAD